VIGILEIKLIRRGEENPTWNVGLKGNSREANPAINPPRLRRVNCGGQVVCGVSTIKPLPQVQGLNGRWVGMTGRQVIGQP